MVICWVDNDRHGFVIFRGASNHRRTTDVDIFNCFGQRYASFCDRGLERIQIDHHQIDRVKTALTRFGFVLRVAATTYEAATQARMPGRHTPLEHVRKCSKARDLANWNVFLPQQDRCSACGNDVDALTLKGARKRSDASFVGNGNQSAGDFHPREALKMEVIPSEVEES